MYKTTCVSPALSFSSDLSFNLSFQLFSPSAAAEHMPGVMGGHEDSRNSLGEDQAFTPLFPTSSARCSLLCFQNIPVPFWFSREYLPESDLAFPDLLFGGPQMSPRFAELSHLMALSRAVHTTTKP